MTKTGFSVGGKRINAFVIQRLLTNEVIRMCHQAVNETLIPDVCWHQVLLAGRSKAWQATVG